MPSSAVASTIACVSSVCRVCGEPFTWPNTLPLTLTLTLTLTRYRDRMSRGRAILSSVLVALGALAYGISPIDVIPELLTGPLGLADDLAVLVGAGFAIWKLMSGSNPGPTGSNPPGAAPPIP